MPISGIIDYYRQFMPLSADTPIVTLGEGWTPLIPAERLSAEIHPRILLWLKFEGLNPTGSFKDRGMTLAMTKAAEEGFKTVMCASTGNTAASAAAYAARAGMSCAVIVPKGKIAAGKLSQVLIHGAKVIQIRGNFDDALRLTRDITAHHHIAMVNSVNEYRLHGQKTGAFEIVEQLDGRAPDFHALPVGNAGNITAYWMGYKEFKDRGVIQNLPRMLGYQASGAAPIVRGHTIENPETFASAIRIGNPARKEEALQARDESGGLIDMVSDDEIRAAYRKLADLEGMFAEPASAAGIAGLFKSAKDGLFDNVTPLDGDRIQVVAVLTGHGLKDPDSAAEASESVTVDATEDAVLDVMNLEKAATASS